jgi:hypothetical protein
MTQQIVGQDAKSVLDPERQFSCGQCAKPLSVKEALSGSPHCPHCKVLLCSFCGCTERAACMSAERGPCAWIENFDAIAMILFAMEAETKGMPAICSECYFQIGERLYYETGRLVQDDFGDLDREIEPDKIKPFQQPVRPAVIG